MTAPRVPGQRAIIDRRELAERIAALADEKGGEARPQVVEALRGALDRARAELARRLAEKPSAGHDCAAGHAFLIDQLLRVIHDYVTGYVYPAANRTSGERLAILAVGGYGRAEMAPHSDVDIAFITPTRRAPWCEQVIEAMLYLLWDLGLKVGHSSRTVSDTMRHAREDLTIRTALLEGRLVWGDGALYEELRERFWKEVAKGSERDFLTRKLAERSQRHKRMGDSRYVVEPNVKDGKGGLRDLQTLYWIGKYMHRVETASQLVDVGLFTRSEYRSFRRAEGFLLAVRCHMHVITGRAEDRLTFDLQREVAAAMNFAERPGKSAVERFMQYYFMQAKRVGTLTGIFLAHIDDEFARTTTRSGFFAGWTQRPRKLKGYMVEGGRIRAPGDDWFADDPVRLIEIFQLAEAEGLEIHPQTLRQIDRDAKHIDGSVRSDTRANALFLDLLAGRNDPETALRWMNEAGVFGRFVPDFGRVNAQMQFDMYHHYTVDEHTIRAIGLLSQIERGLLENDHPRATREIHKVGSRRALYVAVLLHDIAKGRGGDHSVLGAEVAQNLCPRMGLDERETDLVAWLVLHHLLMSSTAQKRDLTDPKTIEDFVGEVRNLDRLRNLAILTAVDIRAVGPGVWNSWKGQLLGELYDASAERLRLGHKEKGRKQRVGVKKDAVRALLGDRATLVDEVGAKLGDAYWIAEPEDIIARNLVQYAEARAIEDRLSIHCEVDEERGATLVSVIAPDHPGLFYRMAGGIHLSGANIIDARIHTAASGYAIDNFLVQDQHGGPFREDGQIARLKKGIRDALAGTGSLVPKLAARPLAHSRAKAFHVAPRVDFDNSASNRFTVIEVTARDRPALLNRLAHALYEANLIVQSAHITAYGESAADTFYVTDLIGSKVTAPERLAEIEARLLEAASDRRQEQLEKS
ncbi:[protein-PII] uridylyltransferase [Erythrobacter litoralis]|uniref:Bifunctional uridylyltransferase/uridylyl-removing enzyme n=1 Tax=Erythrobacter litoralis TaxID=39960 RepID=A0A074MU96_9SPHN|nr:[protein-PII] uridylyltransferase [Erythrobacter litoralis]AOL24855.1 [protein-PII] uridylyltransferase [Erythrobacter litoralis]KEO96380.1 protein-PII uridylyltransferase [Erythrobacter litoralis]